MLKRVLKLIIGVLLIPACCGASIALYHQFLSLHSINRAGWVFLAGIITYIVLYAASLKMTVLYIFGHEAVHALLAILYGGKIISFRISKQGGGVVTNKVNTVISLGPYFIPFYTIVVTVSFLGARFFIPAVERYAAVFMYLLGLSTALHVFMTIDSLRVEQPDLTENGYVFSLAVMYGINAGIISLMISSVFADAGFVLFVRDTADQSWQIYKIIGGVFARMTAAVT